MAVSERVYTCLGDAARLTIPSARRRRRLLRDRRKAGRRAACASSSDAPLTAVRRASSAASDGATSPAARMKLAAPLVSLFAHARPDRALTSCSVGSHAGRLDGLLLFDMQLVCML